MLSIEHGGPVRSFVKRAVRRAVWPLVRPLATRYRALVAATSRNADEAAATGVRLEQLAAQLRVDAEVVGEFSRLARRIVNEVEDRLDDLGMLADHASIERFVLGDPQLRDRIVSHLGKRPLTDLGPGEAEYLQWVNGLDGYRAQADMLFPGPIVTEYTAGGCGLRWVTERIVEVPFVFRALGDLPLGSRVLDVGSRFSEVAASLANLGYRVTALDLQRYPLVHPNLEAVACPVEQWAGPSEPFDAIVALSTVEHLGIGAYGEEPGPADLDRRAMDLFRSWLGSGGLLVLTVAFGPWSVDELQRVYDSDRLGTLLEGWRLHEARYFVQHDMLTWEPCAPGSTSSWPQSSRGVALVTASPS